MDSRSDAGASARAEAERRRASREQKLRSAHPRIGGLILALTDEPQTTRSWAIGAEGEARVGRALDQLPGIHVLHDRLAPGRSRANLDHVVVTSTGVLVVDTKSYEGRIDVSRRALRVGNRDQTKLVVAALRQVDAVRTIVSDVPVGGCLCFVDGDFTLIAPSRCQDVAVLGVRGLTRLVKKMSTRTVIDVAAVVGRLESALRPAHR